MKLSNVKLAMISCDEWDKTSEESGITYKKWSGIKFYDGRPYTRISGNETTNPGVDEKGNPKKCWIAINESITKEEREGDGDSVPIEAEDYGFASIFENLNQETNEISKSVTLVRGKFFGGLLQGPLSGWINTREVTNDKGVVKTYRTLVLNFRQETLDFWEDKVEEPYILEGGPTEDQINAILDQLAEDYPDAAEWYAKFFPGSNDKKVKNAAKRRDLLGPYLNAGAAQTKLGLQKEAAATGKAKASPWAKSK